MGRWSNPFIGNITILRMPKEWESPYQKEIKTEENTLLEKKTKLHIDAIYFECILN